MQLNTPEHSQGSKSKSSSHGASANSTKGKSLCKHCFKSNHTFSSCMYRDYKCKICKKVSNLTQICRSNLDVKNVELTNEQPFNSFDLFNVKMVSYVPPIMITVNINGVRVNMEVDSGAAGSIITEGFLKKNYHRTNYTRAKLILSLSF